MDFHEWRSYRLIKKTDAKKSRPHEYMDKAMPTKHHIIAYTLLYYIWNH